MSLHPLPRSASARLRTAKPLAVLVLIVLSFVVAGVPAELATGARARALTADEAPRQLGAELAQGTSASVGVPAGVLFSEDRVSTATQLPVELRPIGRYGSGGPGPILAEGEWVLASAGSRLFVLRAEESSISVERELELTGGTIVGLAASGGVAFVATQTALTAVDLSAPEGPSPAEPLPLPKGEVVRDITLVGDSVLMAVEPTEGPASLRRVDVSEATLPRHAGHLSLALRTVSRVRASGDVLGVLGYEQGERLELIDVSAPGDPVALGSLGLAPSEGLFLADDLAMGSDHAYITAWQGSPLEPSIEVVDLGDPSAPRVSGRVEESSRCPDLRSRRLVAVDGRLYLTSGCFVEVYDLTDESEPSWLSTAPVFLLGIGAPVAVGAASEHIYVMTASGTLVMMTQFGSMVLDRVSLPMPSLEIAGIDTVGDQLVIADAYHERLLVLDVSDGSNPVPVREIRGVCFNCDEVADPLTVFGRHAFVIGGLITIVDLSEPDRADVVAELTDYDRVVGIAVEGHVAYVPYLDQLDRYDVTDPRAPVLQSSAASPDFQFGFDERMDIEVRDGKVYAQTENGTLAVLDARDPEILRRVGHSWPFEAGEWTAHPSVVVAGDFAYVTSESGLAIVDLERPIRVDDDGVEEYGVVGRFETSAPAMAVAVERSLVYLTDARSLHVLDARQPASIVEVASFEHSEAPSRYAKTVVAGTNVYVATRDGGVHILSLEREAPQDWARSYLPWSIARMASVPDVR